MVTGCFHRDYARLFPRLGTDHDTTVSFWCDRNEHSRSFCPSSNRILCSPHGQSNKHSVLLCDKSSCFLFLWCWPPKSSTERTIRVSFIQGKYVLFKETSSFPCSIFSVTIFFIAAIYGNLIFLHKKVCKFLFGQKTFVSRTKNSGLHSGVVSHIINHF